MFELEALSKMGLQGWPLVGAIGIVCVSFVAWWTGEWPLTHLIDKSTHNYYNDEEKEDEDS